MSQAVDVLSVSSFISRGEMFGGQLSKVSDIKKN